jgi:hypothetical protein
MRGEVGVVNQPAASCATRSRVPASSNRCNGFPAPIKGRRSSADPAHRLATGPQALPGRAWTWSGGSEQEFVIRWQAI